MLFNTITNSLREIKTPEEIDLMRKSVKLSCIAHNEVMKAVGPDMSENEADGIHRYIHRHYGAEDEGYPQLLGLAQMAVFYTMAKTMQPKLTTSYY